jgi:ectoine hydroxylase-related dioxygenase (phytanoyl-CoA dioxygenase family)
MSILDVFSKASGLLTRRRGKSIAVDPGTPLRRKREYERNGFVVGGPLIDEEHLVRLREDFEDIFERRTAPDSDIQHERVDDGDGGEMFKLYDLHLHSPAFREVVTHPRLAKMLGEITDCSRFRVLLDQIQFKPAGSGGWNLWHRDMPSFPFIPPFTALTAWIALDDSTEENGCMRMVPGSHSWGDAHDIAGDDWGLPPLPQRYHGHKVREVLCPMLAGSVEFHHGYTWHFSKPNRTDKPRRAFLILLFNADAKYQEGGRITFPGLSEGDSMESIAPLVIETGRTDAK